MSAMARQITGVPIVYFLHAQSKEKSKLRVTCLCGGIHWWPVNSPHKWSVTRKCFHLMTSSWWNSIARSIISPLYLYGSVLCSSIWSLRTAGEVPTSYLPLSHYNVSYCWHCVLNPTDSVLSVPPEPNLLRPVKKSYGACLMYPCSRTRCSSWCYGHRRYGRPVHKLSTCIYLCVRTTSVWACAMPPW